MPSLLAPDASVSPLVGQPSLRSGDQRCTLLPGTHGLGGRAADALPLASLGSQPRAATLTVSDTGSVVLQRTTASIVVRVDGETIGISPVELRHGAVVEFGECRLILESSAPGAPSSASRTEEQLASGANATSESPARSVGAGAGGQIGVMSPTRTGPKVEPVTEAALVDVRSGARYPLRARRIFIGRDDSCDVIVRGNSVSRRHASVAPVAGGFMLRDESSNGTLVNGQRIVGTYLLDNGDVVRVHDDELRVELDASAPAPVVGGEQTALMDLSHITRGVADEQARAAKRTLTASLEIVRGPFAGACFQVDRVVCSIGRGDENDVRIRDDTVSLTHATLLRKQEAWFVVDLRSMNGTFVDGSRVSGERQLHPGATIRVGGVELVFRAIDSDTKAPAVEPPRPGAWKRIKALMRSVAPPSSAR